MFIPWLRKQVVKYCGYVKIVRDRTGLEGAFKPYVPLKFLYGQWSKVMACLMK